MLARLTTVVAAGLALSSCVLQSTTPLIPESRGERILGRAAAMFRAYDKAEDGKWVARDPSEPGARLTARGNHYLAKWPDKPDLHPVVFAALGGGWYAAELVDTNHATFYALVKPEGADLLMRSLNCETLQAVAPPGAIDFDGSSCAIRPGADALGLLGALLSVPGEPDAKFVRER